MTSFFGVLAVVALVALLVAVPEARVAAGDFLAQVIRAGRELWAGAGR